MPGILVLSFFSCNENSNIDTDLKKKMQVADSLIIADQSVAAEKLLTRLRKDISPDNPLIATYYFLQAEQMLNKTTAMNLYADSALAFFSSQQLISKYPDEYFQSLLIKGDACLKAKQYSDALIYYYKGKKILSRGSCDDGYLASKLGTIYFCQKNFRIAARYWVESYSKLGQCSKKVTEQKMFFLKQGALNNSGYSYYLAGQLDSADHYYQVDLKLINKADSLNLIDKQYVSSARSVLYDNLGGLNLKKNNFAQAIFYLNRCIAIPGDGSDGEKIPPLLKLAEIYISTNETVKAQVALTQSGTLLKQFSADNPESEIKWNKLNAKLFYKQGQIADAYRYQETYTRLKDSFNESNVALYRLDVKRDLLTAQQKQLFEELQQKEKQKRIYLVCLAVILVFSTAIILMINQVLRRSRENQRKLTLQNQQLTHAGNELDQLNKNYIRIMRVMAHDLRNPLSGIAGLATMLISEGDIKDENLQILKLIETTGLHSLEMISELLKSGLADGNEKVQMQNTDINAIMYDSVELLQFKAKEKLQQIIFTGSDKPAIVLINHEKIWRVINNLIVNAIKFSHQGSSIKVSVTKSSGDCIIAVADNGIGIPADEKDSVFEMFTAAKKPGTNGEEAFGLGLSISKRIIDLHKGRLWFENNMGSGTVFYISLPLVTPEA